MVKSRHRKNTGRRLPQFNHLPAAIAIDLDGTLLNSRTELPVRNRTALEACIHRDIPVIIATSRPARIFTRIFPQVLVEKCSYLLMNGALARGRPPLSGYYRESLTDEILRNIVDCTLNFDNAAHITIEIDGYDFGVNWQVDPEQLWRRNSATPDMVLSLEDALQRNPCKLAIGSTAILELAERLKKCYSNEISIVVSSGDRPLLNITSPLATKTTALRRLLTPFGISFDGVLAFGDDFPDIEMLRECGISVAMANALPEVETVCKYQTSSNDEDGVAVVLEKMLISS